MSTLRIKGKHDHVYVIVDDQTQVGSFTKVENFSEKPDAEIQKSKFIGEQESEGDLEHEGFDISFTIHCQDDRADTYWNNVVTKLRSGQRLPQMSLARITNFLDGSAARTVTYEDLVLKMDERNSSSKSDYVKYSFTGFAPRRR